MAVVDASVIVEILLRTPVGRSAFRQLAAATQIMHAPHLLDVEVMYALRRLVQKRELSLPDAGIAITALPQLEIERHAHLLLLPRIWELRESVTAYDAAYVALSEILGTPLLTCDRKLSRSHGHRAEIVLLP
jgi:predicted nucleic acid-binding protein